MPYRIRSNGEMAELIRRFAWEKTQLGAIQSWPDELITTVNLLLESGFPMFLWWGEERIQFYNDAYRPCLREGKHPAALGQRGEECWQEIWPIIGPEIERVRLGGDSIWYENRLVPIFRNGRIEEVFWTYSYSPVRDREGRVEGVIVVCNETTEQVIGERRLRTLLGIEVGSRQERSAAELAKELVGTLAENRADIPLALLYRVEEGEARLVGQTCRNPMQELGAKLPIVKVAERQEPVLLEDLRTRVGEVICEPWPEAVEAIHLQPSGKVQGAEYVLALGVSPRLTFDGNYANFFHLVGNRICGVLESEASHEERRAAEEQRMRLLDTVTEQSELMASIVENAPAGIAVLDGELRVKWCNPFFGDFFDAPWTSATLIGMKLAELVPHSEEIIRIMERVRDMNEPFTTGEYEHVGFKRGTTYWQWSLSRLANGDILNVSSEVTEQVVARRKLEAFSERLHLAQKAARLGTFYWHLWTGSVEWSVEFREVVGFDQMGAAEWEYYIARVHPQDRERLRRELATVAEQGEALQIHDHRVSGADGRERWVTLNGHIHLNTSGGAERIIGTVADITERKRAEKELEESRKEAQQQWAQLEAIYRTAPIGLALFDPVEFRYLRLNSRQAEIVGLPAEEILGKTLTEIAPIEGLHEMFEQVALGKPVINALLEGELPMSPGEHRYWTVNYFPVYDADGSIQAISAASLEITAQKRAELALIQSEKIAAVGRLASSISHEINNPLEAVTNLLFLLRSEGLSTAGMAYLSAAEQELARVSQIATHTLRFHRQATKATEVGAAEMIDPILTLYQGRVSSSGITIEKEYRTKEKVLCLDGEIRQVLNNLIGNSLDAMWRGGRLRLRSQMATEWRSGERALRITIADTGHGMDEVTQRRLFEAFFTTKGIKGTGLGLWISSEIVQKHGGRLRFRSSQREGASGTVFQLYLPMVPAFAEKREVVRSRH